jgi:hypothetical protein
MPQQLLEACEQAHREGRDFPTIWRMILRPHRLVQGLPGHEVVDGETRIVISLSTGQQLLSRTSGFALR